MKLIEGGNNARIFSRTLNVMSKIQDEAIDEDLSGKLDSLFVAESSCLIVDNSKDIGYVYLLGDTKKGLYSLNMAILKKYRNQGFGYLVVQDILDNYGDKGFILCEVKEDNIAGLKLIEKVGAVSVSPNYYLLQPEKLQDFNNFVALNDVKLGETTSDEEDIDFAELYKDDKPKMKIKGRK